MAVIGVILYHVGWLPGGFLGVDVFFVLSGYLITTLLLREFESKGQISLSNFWTRRARRLYPAVLLLVLACVLEAVKIQSESATLAARRGDILSTLFYYANWHFIATDQSYFAAFLGVSPLRHMWSLAIEEQFYLFWPLFMILMLQLRRQALLPVIAAGVVASTAAMAIEYSRSNPSRAYFGTDTRAQVILVGAALAVLMDEGGRLRSWGTARRAAWWIGPLAAIGIVGALALLRDQDKLYYYGGALAFACIVAFGLWALEVLPTSSLATTLGFRPVNWVGRISYSLYLWHWPMILWVSSFAGFSSTTEQKIVAIAATFFMASASYYIVERPIRYGRLPWLRMSKRRLAVALAVSLALVLGVTIQATAVRLDSSQSPCPPGSPQVDDRRWCVRLNPTVPHPRVVATVGDSTSLMLDAGLEGIARKRLWRYVQAGQNGCSILALKNLEGQDAGCAQVVPRLIGDVLASYDPDVWIVADRFALAPLREPNGALIPAGDPRRAGAIEAAFRRTLRRLTSRGAQIVLVATPPPGAPPDCGSKTTGRRCGDPSFRVTDPGTVQLDRIEQTVAAEMRGRVIYVSLTDILCADHGRCAADVGGILARVDGVHFTGRFSRKVVPILVARALRGGARL